MRGGTPSARVEVGPKKSQKPRRDIVGDISKAFPKTTEAMLGPEKPVKKKNLSAAEMIEKRRELEARPILRLDEAQVPFPEQKGVLFKVMDPRNTLPWDVFMLILIMYIMSVTPFELAFIRAPPARDLMYGAAKRRAARA